jgi:hypothetical protein
VGVSGAVYLAYARDDAAEAAAVAHVLRDAGWPVRAGPPPGPAAAWARTRAVKAAAAVVVCWSQAGACDHAVVRAAAAARAADKLILVALDHTPLTADLDSSAAAPGAPRSPACGGVTGAIDLSHWRAGPTQDGRDRLLRALQACAGAPPRPGRRAPQRRILRAGAVLLVAGVLGSAALGVLAGLARQGLDSPPTRLLLAAFGLAVAPPQTRAADNRASPGAPAGAGGLAVWQAQFEAAPRDDPTVLRHLAGRVRAEAAGSPAPGAAGLTALSGAIDQEIARLEVVFWARAEASTDAASALDAVAAYRRAFPEGRFAAESRELERRWRTFVAACQGRLARVGYAVTDPPGVALADTLRAVMSFEAGSGLTPTGLIDRRLAVALGVAGPDLPRAARPAPLSGDPAPTGTSP